MDHPFLKGIKRILLLRVPLDIVPDEELDRVILEIVERDEIGPVVLLTYAKLMKARRDPEFLGYLHKAALVIPVSKSLENAVRFLRLPAIFRYEPFAFTIRALGVLENKHKSLYLLGERHKAIQLIASNMRASFPGLNLVGRHAGFFPRDKEEIILTAVQKATPSFLLIGAGVPGKDKWSFRLSSRLPVRLALFSENVFQIMAGKKKRPSPEVFRKRTFEFSKVLRNPLRLFRIFSLIWFALLLLIYRWRR